MTLDTVLTIGLATATGCMVAHIVMRYAMLRRRPPAPTWLALAGLLLSTAGFALGTRPSWRDGLVGVGMGCVLLSLLLPIVGRTNPRS
ncbi:MAG: hypothetical protein WKG32_16975 [Gemmatimonadaceae bacterium]